MSNIPARARACFAELDTLSMMPSVIERHMAALVADKDAEIAEIHRGRTEYLEEMGFTPSCNWDEAIAEAKELREDLDRHVAALKVAVDALKWCAPKCEHCNAMAIYKEPWTEGDFLCAEHGGVVTDPDMENPITHPATRALQRIEELQKP